MIKSTDIIDKVSTTLESIGREIPRELGYLRKLAMRLDRVSNTLDEYEGEDQGKYHPVSEVEGDLERLGLDFSVGPSFSPNESIRLYVYKGQMDPREERKILKDIANKYRAVIDNPGDNRSYQLIIPRGTER